jgi:hypothetical protein
MTFLYQSWSCESKTSWGLQAIRSPSSTLQCFRGFQFLGQDNKDGSDHLLFPSELHGTVRPRTAPHSTAQHSTSLDQSITGSQVGSRPPAAPPALLLLLLEPFGRERIRDQPLSFWQPLYIRAG